MSPSIRNLTLCVALALFGAGCLDDSERCDPDQKYVLNLCEPNPPDAGATGDAAAGSFGSRCTRGEDCTGDTDTCALQPGAASGFCTHASCKEWPEVCPSNWRCLDLSAYQAGLSMCVEA